MIKKIFIIITLISILESCSTKKESNLTKPPFLVKVNYFIDK
jgi:hypothetical protein